MEETRRKGKNGGAKKDGVENSASNDVSSEVSPAEAENPPFPRAAASPCPVSSSSPLLLFSSSPLLLLSLSALHLLITLPLAYLLNIWSDEASTLYSTGQGVAAAFQNVFANEKQAPLYFLLLGLWRAVDHSVFFARGFSIICSVAAIFFFGRLARRFFSAKLAAFATAFFALHPFLIWASLEIRLYSLVVLFAVALLDLFAAAYLDDDAAPPARAEMWYVLAAIAALYTNYYLGFLLVGNFLALVAVRRFAAARRYFGQMLLVGLAILPLLWMLKLQLATGAGEVESARSLTEGVRLIWTAGLNFLLPTELFPSENVTFVSFARSWIVRLLVLVVAFILYRKRRALDPSLIAFGTISATIGAFLLLAYYLLGDIYVEIRHAAVLFPPVVLFAAFVGICVTGRGAEERRGEEEKRRRGAEDGRGEEEKRRRGESEDRRGEERRNSIIIRRNPVRTGIARSKGRQNLLFSSSPLLLFFLSLLVLVLFTYSVSTLYPHRAKRGDWARVAAFIETRETPGQPIVVFTVFDALNLPYYYHGKNRVLPDKRFFDWGFEGKVGGADAVRTENEFAIAEIPPDAAEIWLATGERCRTTKACDALENFVEANYTIIEDQEFYKERVRLLRKKQK